MVPAQIRAEKTSVSTDFVQRYGMRKKPSVFNRQGRNRLQLSARGLIFISPGESNYAKDIVNTYDYSSYISRVHSNPRRYGRERIEPELFYSARTPSDMDGKIHAGIRLSSLWRMPSGRNRNLFNSIYNAPACPADQSQKCL